MPPSCHWRTHTPHDDPLQRDEITYAVVQGAVVVDAAERLSLMSETERALAETANTHEDLVTATEASGIGSAFKPRSYVHGVQFPLG